jgi:hypothetical protein
MNINISDVIRKQYLQPSGITEVDVNDAVFHEDIKKIIRLDQDLNVIYFLKKKSNHYLLVDGRWSSPNLSISAVFQILPITIEKTGINNPLAVLQKLAEECGYEISIGDIFKGVNLSLMQLFQYRRYIQKLNTIKSCHSSLIFITWKENQMIWLLEITLLNGGRYCFCLCNKY